MPWRRHGFVTKVSDRGLRPLVSYLLELGELCEPSAISSPSEQLIEQFRRYQLEERGLAPDVVSNYARVARMFLGTCSEFISVSLTEVSAATSALSFWTSVANAVWQMLTT